MRVYSFVGLLVVLVATTPAAVAQSNFCELTTRVAKEAHSRFKSLRVGADELEGYRSKIVLPNAQRCWINPDWNNFGCVWNMPFNVDHDQYVRQLAEKIRDCYPKGTFVRGSDGSYTHSYNKVTFRVYRGKRRPSAFLEIAREGR